MRLIDKDELTRRLNTGMDIIEMMQTIIDMPTIEERKTGRWIHERLASTNGGTYAVVRCSECHSQFPMWETRFCPNCGAKMEVEHE